MTICSSWFRQCAYSSCLNSGSRAVCQHWERTPRWGSPRTLPFWHPAVSSNSSFPCGYPAGRWSVNCRASSKSMWRCIQLMRVGLVWKKTSKRIAAWARCYFPSSYKFCLNLSVRTRRYSCCSLLAYAQSLSCRLRWTGLIGRHPAGRSGRKRRSVYPALFRWKYKGQPRHRSRALSWRRLELNLRWHFIIDPL